MPSKLSLSATSSNPLFNLFSEANYLEFLQEIWHGTQFKFKGLKHILFERMSLVECENECSKLGTEGLF